MTPELVSEIRKTRTRHYLIPDVGPVVVVGGDPGEDDIMKFVRETLLPKLRDPSSVRVQKSLGIVYKGIRPEWPRDLFDLKTGQEVTHLYQGEKKQYTVRFPFWMEIGKFDYTRGVGNLTLERTAVGGGSHNAVVCCNQYGMDSFGIQVVEFAAKSVA